MAIEVERLIATLEARLDKYEKGMAKALGTTDRTFKKIEHRGARMEANLAKLGGNAMAGFVRGMGAVGLAIGGTALLDLTGQFTDLSSRVELASGSIERGAAVMDRLSAIARRTYSSLTQTAESWLLNSTALKELGFSTQQQLDLTEALNNSLVISATRGDKAKSVMDAWSKAMAGGALRGDDLNTIIQSGGRLAEALAASMGVSVNQLRKLGSDGKITTEVMFGVTSQLEKLRAEADRMPATASDGFVLLGNAVMRFVGEADKAVGSSSALATAIIGIADAVDRIRESEQFGEALRGLGDEIGKTLSGTQRDFENIRKALDYLANTDVGDTFGAIWDSISGAGAERTKRVLGDIEGQFWELVNAAHALSGPDISVGLQTLTEALIDNKIGAEAAKKQLVEIGAANPDLTPIIGRLYALVETLAAVRDGSYAAAVAVSAIPQGPARGRGGPRRALDRVDLTDDGGLKPPPVDQGAIDAAQKRADAVKALVANLVFEQQQLGRTSAEQDLYNQLKSVGVTRESEFGQQIEAALTPLQQQQELLRQNAEAAQFFGDIAKDALSTFVSDLQQGKSAAEALSNVLGNLANKLLNSGLDKLTSSLFGAFTGGGATGGVMGNGLWGSAIFGGARASGGPVSAGKAYLVGERGPEMIVPRSAATVVPNQTLVAANGNGARGPVVNNVYNYGSDDVRTQKNGSGGIDVIVGEAKRQIYRDMADGKLRSLGVAGSPRRRS